MQKVVAWLDGGLGAVAVSTALIESQKNNDIVVCSSYPEIFYNNPYVSDLFSMEDQAICYTKYLEKKNPILIRSQYMKYRPTITNRHIIDLMFLNNGIKRNEAQPKLYLNDFEKYCFENAWEEGKKRIILHINGSTTKDTKWNHNKELNFEHWQSVIMACQNADIIQVGMENEYKLEGIKDLRGKTNIRELISLINSCDYVISIESSIAHIAGILGKKGVVFYTSTSPKAFGYSTLIPIIPEKGCRFCGRPETHWGDIRQINGQKIPFICQKKECVKNIDLLNIKKVIKTLDTAL